MHMKMGEGPISSRDLGRKEALFYPCAFGALYTTFGGLKEAMAIEEESKGAIQAIDVGSYKLPYEHENLQFKQFLGSKATILFNMKIDDPQTVLQFPDLVEIYKKYSKEGLNVHAFPTEQVLHSLCLRRLLRKIHAILFLL
jgi:hypothetical protein